jgi:hypothetical protein
MRYSALIVVLGLTVGCGKSAVEPVQLKPLPPYVTKVLVSPEAERQAAREAAQKLMRTPQRKLKAWADAKAETEANQPAADEH